MALINQTLNGYTFTEFIGAGGFGSVYKAVKDNNTYAIKVFREDYILQEYKQSGENNRIQREIDIMKTVSHPFLIKYVDDFKGSDLNVPSYFLVMEYAEGVTLQNIIKSKGLTNEAQTVEIFKNILEGIKGLHQVRGIDENKGIIHRDLKPENIIVNGNTVKILDYGISKVIDYTALTSTGNFLGSPLYSSPEQITDSKHIDKRSDLYTLGVIFYEMLTSKVPYEFTNLPELIDKIKNESPVPPRKYFSTITNKFENIIFKLLEKNPYQRYLNIDELITVFNSDDSTPLREYDTSPKFVLRLWNDGSALEEYLKISDEKMYVDFPAIHQFQQKKLLQLIQGNQFVRIIDPETVRFAYDTYTDREGLKKLPYCPKNFEVITPAYLNTYKKQQDYVKLVIDEEANLGADIFVSPYHYTHNTTVLPTYKQNPVEQWFDLDIKLLKESIDYKNSVAAYKDKKLYAGICINSSSLTDNQYKSDLLNYYSAHECDGYIVYADGIDKDATDVVIYHYVDTLLRLQRFTGRPVIAGRLNSLGLGLISLGLSGFSSGAARFESFSEELHKEAGAGYNLYERYYFPELLGTVPIEKKTPTRLNQISNVLGACTCPFCNGKPAEDVIKAQNNKLHYLYSMNREVEIIKNTSNAHEYFLKRIDAAIYNYQRLTAVYKRDDYKHLFNWKKVFENIK
ncbi:MAG TPA: serine/threonine-protein kinase [Chitinophagaceae bacterium]|nr:serine/threonine-protein kinase [Chitinophagaceae bacterium]